jgi:hypothetical protein
MVALLMAWPAAAQEQRGAIEGVVRDSSGAVLPGVTVEARTATGVVLTTTTDDTGTFRFPSVPPGSYVVSATLDNFAPGKIDPVIVGLGQVKKADFALSPKGVTESVQVVAESPLVDVRQSARQTNIRAEQVELMPKGRDFSTLVAQAPGANQEAKLGGLSIDGASAGENRFIIDGIETNDVQHGTQGKNVIVDFVEEVQVKSSGYTAEFGGATGGVINVLTKSGTNDWRGNALFNWQGSKLRGSNVPTLRVKLDNPLAAEYITYPKDTVNRIEPGFALGGPIARNRAWFFGAYQPAFTTNERQVNSSTAQNPNLAGSFDEDQQEKVQYITGNVTSQFSDSLRGRLAYNNSWSKREGLLPALTGTDPAGTNYGYTQTFPNYSLSGNLDWVASPKLFFGVRAGYYRSDINDSNTTDAIRYLFSTGSNFCGATCPFPEVPTSLQRLNGFSSVPNNSKVTRDEQTRAYAQGDGTVYASMAGEHQVKFGMQYDRVGNDVLNALEDRNLVRLRWDSSPGGGVRGRYGYYQVRSNAVDPKKGFVTAGKIHTENIGLFIQDSWTINNRLTINAGIRTERERVPTYQTGTDIPEFGVAFDFKDKFAPRLGFAYDLKGDGRTKAFGSWGMFYDIFKLELPRGSFGGDRWLEYYFTLDTYDWTTLADGPNCPPACVGTLIDPVASGLGTNPIDFRSVSLDENHIDPDLKPMKLQEATFGIEHQLNDVIALQVRYVHKQIDRAIEDTQTAKLDASGTEIYIIANPGEGLATEAFLDPFVAIPKPVRDYDSVEFAAEKRFANNWYFRGSYLWSRLYGNYSGLSQSDENGRTSPNVGRLWDYPLMMFQDGGVPALGRLATDRPHQLKAAFIYQFNFGTSVGVNQFVASGLPISREIGTFGSNNLPVNYLGRMSDGRTPTFSQTDLLVQHGFRLGGGRQLQVSFNVLNLFNQDTTIGVFSTQQRVNGVTPNQELFYTGAQTLQQLIDARMAVDPGFQDPRFLMDNAFQAPIQARFGVKTMGESKS